MKTDYRLIITIATILISVGSAYGVTQHRLKGLDQTKEKVVDLDKRAIKTETEVDYLEQNLMEQRTLIKEQREDVKQILQLLLNR